jgi:hypothetical protein
MHVFTTKVRSSELKLALRVPQNAGFAVKMDLQDVPYKEDEIMLNPSDPRDSGSYVDLQKRMLARLQAAKIDEQILDILQKACERELTAEQIVLSKPEKERLFGQSVKAVLTGVLTKFEGSK